VIEKMALKWRRKKKDKQSKKNQSSQDNNQSSHDLVSDDLIDNKDDSIQEVCLNNDPSIESETDNLMEDQNDSYAEAVDNEDIKKPVKKKRFKRLRERLSRTRAKLGFSFKNKTIQDEDLEELEEQLITSDMGVEMAMEIMEELSSSLKKKHIVTVDQLKEELKTFLVNQLPAGEADRKIQIQSKPHVILVVGVNGVGKTTTIGKMAARFKDDQKQVIIAAADTFRAAAIEQLSLWADRADADLIRHRENSDPAAVAFDAVQAAIARKADIVLVDTAGRLHTKTNLMEEIKKIRRSIQKKLPDAPHEILLVVDATTGQNAVSQAKQFHEALQLTGIVLTKLDGTAKGGIVFNIYNSLKIPIQYIGIGEQLEDFQIFDADDFVSAII